ncbi:hypothetical protein IQ07DRAFT_346784 [Pyrenochaeta sp. DS3sAY3a]|nr:hypothetical protein IQ07DRAFT_346784 [Pyrenochaeta sp. DS3sAY3a]
MLGEAFSEVRCSSGNLATQGRAPDEWCEKAWDETMVSWGQRALYSLMSRTGNGMRRIRPWACVGLCGQSRSDLIWDYSSVEGPREWIGGSPCGAVNVGAMQITARAGVAEEVPTEPSIALQFHRCRAPWPLSSRPFRIVSILSTLTLIARCSELSPQPQARSRTL